MNRITYSFLQKSSNEFYVYQDHYTNHIITVKGTLNYAIDKLIDYILNEDKDNLLSQIIAEEVEVWVDYIKLENLKNKAIKAMVSGSA